MCSSTRGSIRTNAPSTLSPWKAVMTSWRTDVAGATCCVGRSLSNNRSNSTIILRHSCAASIFGSSLLNYYNLTYNHCTEAASSWINIQIDTKDSWKLETYGGCWNWRDRHGYLGSRQLIRCNASQGTYSAGDGL